MKNYHIQLHVNDSFKTIAAYSLTEAMVGLGHDWNTTPYSYFTTQSDLKWNI